MTRPGAMMLAACLVVGLALGCDRNSGPPPAAASAEKAGGVRVSKGVAPQIGYTAPDFELPDINGEKHRLSDYRGRVVLLNFWATWCGPCRIEMPALQALTEDYAAQPFQVVSVAGDFEGVPKVAPFMERLRLTFPGLIDSEGTAQDMYYVNALPMTYVLDRHGIVVYKFVGFFDWNSPRYRKMVDDLLQEA